MRLARLIFLSWVVLASGEARSDEPCNPILDGTYCATQMPKNRDYSGTDTDRSRCRSYRA